MKKGKKISLYDWQNILYKMNFYRLQSGFVDYDLFGQITLFVSNPQINGVDAMPVTKEEVLSFINNY
jgi:hypothetical protein